jgi:hypothetical protein
MSGLSHSQVVAGLELLTDTEKREGRKASAVLAVRLAEQRQAEHAAEWRRRVGKGVAGPSEQRQ